MPWTEITRPDYDRRGLRCASDVTGAEWALAGVHGPASWTSSTGTCGPQMTAAHRSRDCCTTTSGLPGLSSRIRCFPAAAL